MKRWLMLWWLLLPGLAFAACNDGVNEGLGPVMVRSESPFQALRLTPMPRDPYLLCAGQQQFRAMSSLVAIWSQDATHTSPGVLNPIPRYRLNLEMLDTHLALAGGLRGGWAYEVSYDDRRPVVAGLRRLVIGFHQDLGISNDGRVDFPTDETLIDIPPYGVHLDGHNVPLLARAFQFTVSRQLIRAHAWLPTTAVSLTVRKALFSSSPFENGAVDVSGELSMALPVRDDFVYTDLSYIHFGSDHAGPVPLESHELVGMLGYEWTLSGRSALIGQYLYSQGVVKNLNEFSKPSHELFFGYKRRATATTWQFGIIENLQPYNNSPDFGLNFGLSYDL